MATLESRVSQLESLSPQNADEVAVIFVNEGETPDAARVRSSVASDFTGLVLAVSFIEAENGKR